MQLCDELGIDYSNASLWLKAVAIPPEIIQLDLSMIEKGRAVNEIFKAEEADLEKKELAKSLKKYL